MQTLATGISTQTKGFTLIELLLVLLIIGIISLIPIINSSFVRGYQEGGPTQINELFNALKQESQLIRKPIAIEENNEKYSLVFYDDGSWKDYEILDFDLNIILKNYAFDSFNNTFLENKDRSFLIIFS
jgi:prepilin-type N-terminal cleavage/methylation domain-containing protein